MSAYYATPGSVPLAGTEQQAPGPVLVAFADPAPQSRLTVLVRIFMVIPHLIVLELLGIAAYVVTVIGWFGALFTGRLPAFAATFLTGYLRWQTRVSAYAVLLTDAYPPFSLEDADYPVRLAVTPGPLNRLAVLFRFFLLIPCWLVAGVLAYGAFTVVQVVTWVIVLITGQMPASLYQALAAVTRYQVRTNAFGLMLTSEYPGGLFGETALPASKTGYGSQYEYGRLVLSSGARKLLAAFIVLGVLFAGATIATEVAVGHNLVSTVSASNQVENDLVPVVEVIDNYAANVQACKGQLACAQGIDRTVASTLNTFAGKLKTVSMPSGQASSAAAALRSSALNSASIFSRLAVATTPTQYINIAKSANLDQSVNQINQKYTNLLNVLHS